MTYSQTWGAAMDAELISLANSAGTTLVQLMASSAWERISAGVARLWHRHRPEDAELVETDLAEMRADLLGSGADPAAQRMAATAWQMQFRALLASGGPELAQELRVLVESGFLPAPGAQGTSFGGNVQMKAEARDNATINQLGQGTLIVNAAVRPEPAAEQR
ncbi:hypothetical protein ACFYS8_06045 [Kitasatospora sp. NPDC004615]|uniref:hypothetical protein n=1 Tax=unclassified Kitasatospora TaxID=2633591 RepID=UPI003696D3E6